MKTALKPIVLAVDAALNSVVAVVGDRKVLIPTKESFSQFLRDQARDQHAPVEDLTIACSSTMDFPEDFTKNSQVIALAKEIRG